MLFFLYLGITNARRNIERSLLAVLSMALATAVFMYSISLGRGHAAGLFGATRAYLGGDIVAYSYILDSGGVAADAELHYNRLYESPLTDLDIFHPELFEAGYLTSLDGVSGSFFGQQTLYDLSIADGIAGIYPRFQFPALRIKNPEHSQESNQIVKEVKVVGRDLELDALQQHQLQNSITSGPSRNPITGRWFTPEDEGEMVCVLFEDQQELKTFLDFPQVGDIITIEVPNILYSDSGRMYFDYSQTITAEFEVIGLIRIPAQEIVANNGATRILNWSFNDIVLSLGTWEKIWQISGGQTYTPQQVGLRVTDEGFVENTLSSLRQAFPQYTFYNVAVQAQRTARTLEWQRLDAIPKEMYALQAGKQGDIQEDIRVPLIIVLMATASLVIASNLLIMVTERAKETAILKAIGSTRRQVMCDGCW